MRSSPCLALLCTILLLGCAARPLPRPVPILPTLTDDPTPLPSATASRTATPSPATPTVVPSNTPATTPSVLRLWFDPSTPEQLRGLVTSALRDLPAGQNMVEAPSAEQADLRVGPNLQPALGSWVYAAVAPFPTLADQVSWEAIRGFWGGDAGALASLSSGQRAPTLYLAEETLVVLRAILGEPNPRTPIVVALPGELVDKAWAARPLAWAVVPFDALEPRWKALRVDGAGVLDKALDVGGYPLALTFGASGRGAEELAALLARGARLATNRDPQQMTVLLMTGVTALVRATANEMEAHGVLYPAALISGTLRDADLTHISNEVPFAADCPPPDPAQQTMTFCSSPRYIDLLRAVGTDVVELTGNHFQDYGSQATLDTIAMYRQEGWGTFGGGSDLAEALQPLILTRNGNHIAFVGCNPVGPDYAWATAEQPGAAPCDDAVAHETVARLKADGNVTVATFQYWEEYQTVPTPKQQEDFRAMVDAGAAIVSGSQAHQPQAFEFYGGGFIHYGLGNLFFDQMFDLTVRQEFVDRHVIYRGRHISTELYTFMLEDWSQPRPMTPDERRELLAAVFAASGW